MLDSANSWIAIAALSASLSALFAALYTWLTYRLVRSQTEPNVVVYTRHDESRASIILLVIENVGRGLASDVEFTSSRPIPAEAFGIGEDSPNKAQVMTDGPLISGIPTLGPGVSRKITWGQYGGLKRALGDETLRIECNFKHGKRKMKPTISNLEVDSYAGTDATASEGARVIKELGKIAKHSERIARTLKASQR